MNRLSSWLSGGKPDDTDPQAELERDIGNLVQAMRGTTRLINDDIDGAQIELQKGDSSYHDMGSALVFFLKSILGFERENMNKASELLSKCEARAWSDLKRAQRRAAAGHAAGGQVYPAGTEYELVVAQTQIMSAVVGVLHESIIEGMKSFLKLRRAYMTLEAIIAKEDEYRARRLAASVSTVQSEASAGNGSDRDSTDAKDVFSGAQTPASSSTSLEGASTTTTNKTGRLRDISSDLTSPIDIFVHSGTNMCMGILLLILSLIPPAFGRILSVVGFRGDREKGIGMLWQSVAYSNINGAVAGIMLLNFYHSILEIVDIQPHEADFDESAESYGTPREKCSQLLTVMRQRFPETRMWVIEEAKSRAADKDLAGAIAELERGDEGKMKQMTALNDFTLGIFAMSAQDWRLMRKVFLRCLDVNEWSTALYYYMAGSASLELYRDALHRGDAAEAATEKAEAEKNLRRTKEVASKKRFLARQLPFETFIQRKLQKWEARARALELDLADAVGVSPAMEMIYLWNGQKFMSAAEYEMAEKNLAWSRLTASPEEKRQKLLEEKEEWGVWAVTTSSIFRGAQRLEEARGILQEHVLDHDRCV